MQKINMEKKMKNILLILILICSTNFTFAEITFDKHIIGENQKTTMCVISVDIDKDGDKDIITASYNKNGVIWWKNDGKQNFSKHILGKNYGSARTVYADDLDKDGDIDILAAGYKSGKLTWFENDGKQNFREKSISEIFAGAHTISTSDIDGDGDIDVMGAAFTRKRTGKLSWFENDGKQNFKEHILSNKVSSCVYGADIDKDGDIDIIGSMYMNSEILWWKNNGDKTFTEKIISKSFRLPHWARTVDLDNDGDIDIIGAGCGRSVSWWENDGKENFREHKISNNFACASSIYSADIDNDGDIDIFSTSERHHDIRWWENNGKQIFKEHTVSGLFPGASDVYIDDLDSDGDLDVLGAGNIENQISWWENKEKTIFDKNKVLTEDQFFAFIRTKGSEQALDLYKNNKKIKFREIYMNNLGYELLGKKNIKDAINIFTLNLIAYPNSPNTYLSLTEGYLSQNNIEKAKEYYNRSKEITSKVIPIHKQLKLSLLLNDKKEFNNLLDDIKKNNSTKYKLRENALNLIGYQLMGRNLIDEAIIVFKTNAELFPNSFNVFDSMGEAYMKKGNSKLAIQNYKNSFKINPKNKNAENMIKKLEKKIK